MTLLEIDFCLMKLLHRFFITPTFVISAYETLVGQLKKETHATTAMKEGLLREPIAAEAYAKVSA